MLLGEHGCSLEGMDAPRRAWVLLGGQLLLLLYKELSSEVGVPHFCCLLPPSSPWDYVLALKSEFWELGHWATVPDRL